MAVHLTHFGDVAKRYSGMLFWSRLYSFSIQNQASIFRRFMNAVIYCPDPILTREDEELLHQVPHYHACL